MSNQIYANSSEQYQTVGNVNSPSVQTNSLTLIGSQLDSAPTKILTLSGNNVKYTDSVVTQNNPVSLSNKTLINPIMSSFTNAGATITVPTLPGTLINDVRSAPGLVCPVLASFVSTNGQAIFNGISSGNIDFIVPTLAPFGGGNIVLSPGLKAVLTDASQTLTNKTIQDLTSTGNAISLFNGKLLHNYVTRTTVGGVTNTLLSVSIPVNTAISIDCRVTGFCTVGPDIGKYVAYNSSFVGANNAGTPALGTIMSNSSRSGGFSGAILAAQLSGTTININVTGIASDTINWTGDIAVTYQ